MPHGAAHRRCPLRDRIAATGCSRGTCARGRRGASPGGGRRGIGWGRPQRFPTVRNTCRTVLRTAGGHGDRTPGRSRGTRARGRRGASPGGGRHGRMATVRGDSRRYWTHAARCCAPPLATGIAPRAVAAGPVPAGDAERRRAGDGMASDGGGPPTIPERYGNGSTPRGALDALVVAVPSRPYSAATSSLYSRCHSARPSIGVGDAARNEHERSVVGVEQARRRRRRRRRGRKRSCPRRRAAGRRWRSGRRATPSAPARRATARSRPSRAAARGCRCSAVSSRRKRSAPTG